MTRGWLSIVALLFPLVAGCQARGPICSSTGLAAALAEAFRGDRVRVGACRLEGSFTVPAGVALEGLGDRSVLAGGDDGPVVVLEAEGGETTLRGLTVESDGPFGVYAEGGEAVRLEGVSVLSTRGVGIGLEGLDRAVLEDVSARGPVTEANAETFPPMPSREDTAILGLILIRVAEAELSGVAVNGFAGFGVILAESSTHWQEGNASKNLGCGLTVQRGTALLEDVVLCDTFRGASLIPAYGGYFPDAEVETRGVEVCATEGTGLLHLAGEAVHADLGAHDNDEGGLWAQHTLALEVRGRGTTFSGNRFVGLAVLDARGPVRVSGASVEQTAEGLRFYERALTVTSGDGIHLVRPASTVALSDLRLAANERVGLLLDGPGEPSSLTIEGVTVDGVADQLGAIAQGAAIPDGWDDGVIREGETAANDAAHEGELQVILGLGEADLPESTTLVDRGLDDLLFDR